MTYHHSTTHLPRLTDSTAAATSSSSGNNTSSTSANVTANCVSFFNNGKPCSIAVDIKSNQRLPPRRNSGFNRLRLFQIFSELADDCRAKLKQSFNEDFSPTSSFVADSFQTFNSKFDRTTMSQIDVMSSKQPGDGSRSFQASNKVRPILKTSAAYVDNHHHRHHLLLNSYTKRHEAIYEGVDPQCLAHKLRLVELDSSGCAILSRYDAILYYSPSPSDSPSRQ